jgi:hypothetical protein
VLIVPSLPEPNYLQTARVHFRPPLSSPPPTPVHTSNCIVRRTPHSSFSIVAPPPPSTFPVTHKYPLAVRVHRKGRCTACLCGGCGNGKKCPFGCNGCVTDMAVGQRQRLYSGVRMLTGNYLSSTPRALRFSGVQLERTTLMYKMSKGPTRMNGTGIFYISPRNTFLYNLIQILPLGTRLQFVKGGAPGTVLWLWRKP